MLHGLIINDNIDDQILILERLKGFAHFDVADDGRAGLKIAETINFDFILLDIYMPIMTGFEVLERMTPANRVKTIVMSTNNDGETIVHSIQRGGMYFLNADARTIEIKATLKRMGLIVKDGV